MMSVDDDAADRAFLLDALCAHPGEWFSAARLQLRGMPKMQVRRLLTSIEGVTISEERDGLWFSWTGAFRVEVEQHIVAARKRDPPVRRRHRKRS